MQQSVLLAAVRGPDGVHKEHPVKGMLRWYRRCILISAFDKRALTSPIDPGGGKFTGPTKDIIKSRFDYLKSIDELPWHFNTHFM